MSVIIYTRTQKDNEIDSIRNKKLNHIKNKFYIPEDDSFLYLNFQQMIDETFYEDFLKSLKETKDKIDFRKEKRERLFKKEFLKNKKGIMIKYDVNEQFKNVEKIDPRKQLRRSISSINCGEKQHYFNIFQLKYSKNIIKRKKFVDEKNKSNVTKENQQDNNYEINKNKYNNYENNSNQIDNDYNNRNKKETINLNKNCLIQSKNKNFFSCLSCL